MIRGLLGFEHDIWEFALLKPLSCYLVSALIAAAMSPATGQQSVEGPTPTTAESPQKPPLPNTLMDGTPIRLRLGRTISSASEKDGNEVDFETLDEIKVNGVIVIPKGSLASGTVTDVAQKKNMGRAGKMDVSIDYVRLADGEKAALKATAGGKAGGHVGAMTGAMVATSIVFFPAAPLFLFMHGKDLTLPKGTEVTAYVNGDIPLTMAKFTAVEPTAAEPASSAGLALVSISSNVDHCEVEIDGAFAGTTPSQLSLAPGTHKITVSQNGYVPWSKTVLITSSGLHLRADLGTAPVEPAVSPTTATAAPR